MQFWWHLMNSSYEHRDWDLALFCLNLVFDEDRNGWDRSKNWTSAQITGGSWHTKYDSESLQDATEEDFEQRSVSFEHEDWAPLKQTHFTSNAFQGCANPSGNLLMNWITCSKQGFDRFISGSRILIPSLSFSEAAQILKYQFLSLPILTILQIPWDRIWFGGWWH